MKKLAFLLIIAIIAGCSVGHYDEPNSPDYSDDTNTPSSNTDNTNNNKPIKQPDNNTQIPTQPKPDYNETSKNITVNLVNNSSYYSYTFRISGKEYIVEKNNYKTLILENKKHSASVRNNEGEPKNGVYKGIHFTKDLWYNDYIPNNHSFYTHEKESIIIRNYTDDQLKVVINDGEFIAPFLVSAGEIYSVNVDLGYYNVKLYEMDYILFQDTYEYDIALTETETLAGLLTITE